MSRRLETKWARSNDSAEFERFSKDSCGAISRNESRTTLITTWALFGVALFFIAGRFLARPERLKGSGYGTDDWTILGTLAVLVPFNAIIQDMTVNGLGADNYTLSAGSITAFLKVSGVSSNRCEVEWFRFVVFHPSGFDWCSTLHLKR